MDKPNNRTILIAVAGGIGSGKSVISHVLRTLGYDVYDCDSRAKALMEQSVEIKKRIANEIDEDAIAFSTTAEWADAAINRRKLAEVVFADIQKLERLNAIVHASVIDDIHRWHISKGKCGRKVVFVESAVLFTSGLYRHVDEIWHVTAPYATRLMRAMSRDNATEEAIVSRMRSQCQEQKMLDDITEMPIHLIDNDGRQAVLPRIFNLLSFYI